MSSNAEFAIGPASDYKRVVLTVPNYTGRIANVAQTTIGPPLGLAYMAAVLLARGFEVSIVDANAEGLSDAETVGRIVAAKPDVAGFTAVTPTVDQCGRLAAEVRSRLPAALIVIGGIHPTVLSEDTLRRLPALDVVMRGESDVRFADLLDGLRNGKSLEEFDGIAWRDRGEIRVSGWSKRLENLDDLPVPARHLLPMDLYIGPDGGCFTTMVGARGCPGRCIYCSVNQSFGGKLRNRNPSLVAAEMKRCHEEFGTKIFGFIDDTFTTNVKWVHQVCDEIIASELRGKIRWFCLTRVDKVTPDLLAHMREAGCFKLDMGIESGDQRVLDYFSKGTSTEQVLNAFKWAREAKMETMAFVMLFSPVETRESLSATEKLLFRADPDLLQASFCTPYPGTKLSSACVEEGIPVLDDWSKFIFLSGPVFEHPRFTRGEMIAWHRNLLRSFYFRPRIVFRFLRKLVLRGGWRGFFRTAFSSMRSLWLK